MQTKGLLSQSQLKQGKGIGEDVSEQYIEFYVAGYTKKIYNIDLQQNHTRIFQAVVDQYGYKKPVEVETHLFPFGRQSRVKLVHERGNVYDLYATLVLIKIPGDDKYIHMGWVPKLISETINRNMDMLDLGWVKKSRIYHNKFSTKVAIPYRIPTDIEKTVSSRFDGILDD